MLAGGSHTLKACGGDELPVGHARHSGCDWLCPPQEPARAETGWGVRQVAIQYDSSMASLGCHLLSYFLELRSTLESLGKGSKGSATATFDYIRFKTSNERLSMRISLETRSCMLAELSES